MHEQLLAQLVPLGHCVSTLLECAASSSSNTICKESLASLCALAGLDATPLLAAARLQASPDDLCDFSKAVHSYLSLVRSCIGADQCNRGRVLAAFLPGVVTGVTRLLTSDANAVESVVTLGLVTWARYVVLVMGGDMGEESTLQLESHQQGRVKMVDRTEAWQQDTAQRLSLLIQRMCVLVTSEVWRVRVQLVGVVHSLLYHCSM